MPQKKINNRTITGLFCLTVLVIFGVFALNRTIQAITTAKKIDEKAAKTNLVSINQVNLKKAIEILNAQKEPITEQFWMEFQELYESSASAN